MAATQAQHNIDLQTELTAEGNISCLAFAKLVEFLAKESEDEAFGLHFVETLPARPGGVFHHIIFNSRTLRDALRSISRFLELVTDAFQIAYIEDDVAGWLVPNAPMTWASKPNFSMARWHSLRCGRVNF